jgi:uncharacterized protein (TIGR02996 family)
MTDQDFLQAVLDHPDDDGPRLVFADWLDDHGRPERAEFIRLQCEAERLAGDDPRCARLLARADRLLAEKGAEQGWAGPLARLAARLEYRRGFVEAVELECGALLANADAVFGSSPIRLLEVGFAWDRAGEQLARLDACRYLSRVESVRLGFGCYFIGDEDFEVLARLPVLLGRLDSLFGQECTVGERGLRPFLVSPHLSRLTVLSLPECELRGAAGVGPLVESPPAGAAHLPRPRQDRPG